MAVKKSSKVQSPNILLDPDAVECPHCKREYSKKVAQRHIEKCAKAMNKPQSPGAAEVEDIEN